MKGVKIDIDQIIAIQQRITRVQARARWRICMARLHREATQERARAAAERHQRNPEGEALHEFTLQLKAKRITPEGFFRLCDLSYARQVSKEDFARMI